MRRILLLIVFSLAWLSFITPIHSAQATEFIKEINYTLEQPFGNTTTVTSFGQYLQLVYSYAAGLIGIMAVVLIMAGGFIWIAAGGNEQKISTAKEIITSAVIAVGIVVLSYAMLVVLNPNLVKLSFSISKIGFTDDENIFDYDKCNSGKFTGNDCTGEDGTSYKCEYVPCGNVATYDGEFCRGQSCADGTGGCYSDPESPTTAQTCQRHYCGDWVETCKKGEYKKYRFNSTQTDEEVMKGCICGYYFKKVMPKIGAPTNLFAYTSAQNDSYRQFCEEGKTQEDWVSFYSATYSTAAVTDWNCKSSTSPGMQCSYDSSFGTCNAQ